MREFEERIEIPPGWMWVLLILFSACIVGWGLTHNLFIMDRPADWEFGQEPDAPSESTYSTEATPVTPPGTIEAPQQIAPLPEAVPMEKATTEKPGNASGGNPK